MEREAEQKEARRREAERKEQERRDSERREAERAEKRAVERKEAERKDAERREAERRRKEEAEAARQREQEHQRERATQQEEERALESSGGNLVNTRALLAASSTAAPAMEAPEEEDSAGITMGDGMVVFGDSDVSLSDDDEPGYLEQSNSSDGADAILSDPFSALLASSFKDINMVKVAGDLEASFSSRGSMSSTGNMLSRNLRDAREQAKVIARCSEPLNAMYRERNRIPEAMWGEGSISWEQFSDFCDHVNITPDLVSPFELQVLFQDNTDEDDEMLAEAFLAECLIQCIRQHSSDWAETSKQLDDLLSRM